MIGTGAYVQIVCDVLEGVAIAVDDMAVEGRLTDDSVWDLARALDHVRAKAQTRLAEATHDGNHEAARHPAIGQFLDRLAASPGRP